ncbi:MAG TPA: tRNA lysidine(34) synthetase TilS [Verrucomicrobiae bacterium]|nr:tRNA lysidine(34) synthetase TilS [Verrucomicrobiae bacterium]
MHVLAQRLLSQIRRQELLRAGDRVGVAVSGGIDSVALLRLMLELRAELGVVLSVVHFNHKLRGPESDADEQFVANLARAHGLEFHADSDDVAQCAREEQISVETAARELRYGFFRYLIGEGKEEPAEEVEDPTRNEDIPNSSATSALTKLDRIVAAHTLDDQAETVLMRLIRGAGMRGLAGIYPRIRVEDDDGEICGEIIRPLLGIRRRELVEYLKDIGQSWREDSSNFDQAFTRNRLRNRILPVLENEFNPAVAENLSDLAEIARGEEEYWENEIAGWMGTVVHWSEPEWARSSSMNLLVQIEATAQQTESQNPRFSRNRGEVGHPAQDDKAPLLREKLDDASWLVMNASVSRAWFLAESEAVQRRLVKAVGEYAGIPLEFKHVEEIVRCAGKESSGKEVSLPLGWNFVRDADELRFITPDLRDEKAIGNYEYELKIPGRISVAELKAAFEAIRVPAGAASGYNPDQLLDAALLRGPLRLRNWRPGDRFWPAHTKSPKKVKELLQERQIAGPERKLWPVLVNGLDKVGEILWIRGFPPPAKYVAKAGGEAVIITERPLETAD